MVNLAQDKSRAVNKLKNMKWVYVASILESMSISDTVENCVAYVKPQGGATIYVGKLYHTLPQEHRENVLIHEAKHIPQIAVKELIDMGLNADKAIAKAKPEVREDFVSKTGAYLGWKNKCDNLGWMQRLTLT